jgi:hypothetical protein
MAATKLSNFTAAELAGVVGITLTRGRPSKALRAELEAKVAEARKAGKVKVKGGKLVAIG